MSFVFVLPVYDGNDNENNFILINCIGTMTAADWIQQVSISTAHLNFGIVFWNSCVCACVRAFVCACVCVCVLTGGGLKYKASWKIKFRVFQIEIHYEPWSLVLVVVYSVRFYEFNVVENNVRIWAWFGWIREASHTPWQRHTQNCKFVLTTNTSKAPYANMDWL